MKYKTNKDISKTQTHYAYNLKMNKDDYETLDIIQEENVEDRNAIQIKFYDERWRTPKDTIEMLKKIIIILEEDFK